MAIAIRSLETQLRGIDTRVAGLSAPAAQTWHDQAQAVLFHLARRQPKPLLLCLLGGTGAGKSTLVNRLEAELCAADFRRTFTAGPVAVCGPNLAPPPQWLGMEHRTAAALPARGESDVLTRVAASHHVLENLLIVDTPDLDGDQPVHHELADRAFRWGEIILFLVSPEKYQMTELLPYYRLARRYALPAIFVMNKCLSENMLEDYRALVEGEFPNAKLFSIPRDDAAYQPPPESDLKALRGELSRTAPAPDDQRESALRVRCEDLLGRLRDQVLTPLRNDRRDVDVAVQALFAMESPASGVDVNPITEQLQRRLQQRSVLYLIGPGRVLDRVRQVPEMLVRLPRTAWDFLFGRPVSAALAQPQSEPDPPPRQVPDFRQALFDQLVIIQSRIDDILRATPAGARWAAADDYAACKLDPAEAGKIVEEELRDLNDWLTRRWNATPRDTVLLLRLLRHLPGGEKLTQWTEAAPYLLTIIVAAHHAFFGHIDLMILGGYTLATWITERLSNEVASRTRQANRAIAERFEKLAHRQIAQVVLWLQNRAPSAAVLQGIESSADQLQEALHDAR